MLRLLCFMKPQKRISKSTKLRLNSYEICDMQLTSCATSTSVYFQNMIQLNPYNLINYVENN